VTTAVEVSHARKRFVLRHTRSLKERVVMAVKGKNAADSFLALDDVSLDISSGDAVALLGLNGSGKSTLLKLISGVMLPDEGSVCVAGRVAGLIEVGAGMHPDLTGRENVYLNGAILGMDEPTLDREFDRIVDFSGIERFIDTEVKFYSSGMFLRLAFAVAAHSEPDIFLVDEILAVGDEPFQRKCLNRIRSLRDEGRTMVLVTHDLDMVQGLCTRGVVLEGGRVALEGTAEQAVLSLRGSSS
jgi:ABC-2 type transport system ATP-binding protein